ncbi:hypothetical protein IV102_01295 [bacterium]|nr:hypothetical protein [bacterium]
MIYQERAPVLSELDLGWEELLDPLLDMRFDPRSAHRFLEILASIQPADVLDRELVRRLWTIPLLLDRIGNSLQVEYDDLYRERFVPWEQSVFIELARILGEPYDLSKR